ncbi:MAG: hypothetical protein IKO83_02190 [Oscillospiraceae bacterium]|nr:hypothetical protein [Oscillospiraceae bacterium]
MKKETKKTSYTVAFCALMAALGTALMATGGLIPVATYCSPLLAGLLLLPVLVEFGAREGWMVWAVTAALSLILSPDKEAGSMYLFLGWYPILKPAFDRIRPRLLGWAAKLGVFALAFAVMYALLCLVFQLEELLEDLGAVSLAVNLAFYLMLLVVMLLYDFILGRMLPLYVYRLRPRLKLPRR